MGVCQEGNKRSVSHEVMELPPSLRPRKRERGQMERMEWVEDGGMILKREKEGDLVWSARAKIGDVKRGEIWTANDQQKRRSHQDLASVHQVPIHCDLFRVDIWSLPPLPVVGFFI